MRRHTIWRADPGRAPALARSARLVRASHERWDGEGYPDGLAGEEIPWRPHRRRLRRLRRHGRGPALPPGAARRRARGAPALLRFAVRPRRGRGVLRRHGRRARSRCPPPRRRSNPRLIAQRPVRAPLLARSSRAACCAPLLDRDDAGGARQPEHDGIILFAGGTESAQLRGGSPAKVGDVRAAARHRQPLHLAAMDPLSESRVVPRRACAVSIHPGNPRPICRSFALLAQLVEHFHGNEGVDGSSPAEGSNEIPANWGFALLELRMHWSGRGTPAEHHRPWGTPIAPAGGDCARHPGGFRGGHVGARGLARSAPLR